MKTYGFVLLFLNAVASWAPHSLAGQSPDSLEVGAATMFLRQGSSQTKAAARLTEYSSLLDSASALLSTREERLQQARGEILARLVEMTSAQEQAIQRAGRARTSAGYRRTLHGRIAHLNRDIGIEIARLEANQDSLAVLAERRTKMDQRRRLLVAAGIRLSGRSGYSPPGPFPSSPSFSAFLPRRMPGDTACLGFSQDTAEADTFPGGFNYRSEPMWYRIGFPPLDTTILHYEMGLSLVKRQSVGTTGLAEEMDEEILFELAEAFDDKVPVTIVSRPEPGALVYFVTARGRQRGDKPDTLERETNNPQEIYRGCYYIWAQWKDGRTTDQNRKQCIEYGGVTIDLR